MRTSVKFLAIYRHKDKYGVSEMCRFFGVSRSGYYGYVARMDIPALDLPLAEKIKNAKKNEAELTVTAEYIFDLKDTGYIEIKRQYFVLCKSIACYL